MLDRLKSLWTSLKASLASLWAKLTTDVSVLWQQDKAFVILFGSVLLVIKFRQLLISLITYSAKVLFEKAEKQSDALIKQEDQNNTQANQLIEDANSLNNTNTPVDVDWYKK